MISPQLKAKLQTLPLEPGCYLMKDRNGTIIYVGKAKKLKNRVNQYFVGAHNYKTTKLVSNIADFDYIVTSSEKEALVLEINLIKKHRPRYNIMFMDDSSYPYIKLTSEPYPTLRVVRDAKKDRRARYYGPFPDASAAHSTMKLLNQLYPLRKCEKMPKKVCLYYHLGQCLGPCEMKVDPEIYKEITDRITRFLRGDVKDLVAQLQQKMDAAVSELAFERAKEYRDLITAIEHITDKQQVQVEDHRDRDVFACYADKGYLAIQGFFIRSGKLLERQLSLTPLYGDPQEELISFLVQYYQSHPLPQEVIVPLQLDIEALQQVITCKLIQPVRGYRKKLLEMAANNAKTNLLQKFEVMERQSGATEQAMQQLAQKLRIPGLSRIEIFDNSHTAGAFTVAGMVVFEDGMPCKNEYRLFRLHTGNSDVDSMKEALYRRYFRLLSEGGRFPDLLIVDGGITQIEAARQILTSLDLDIPIAGLVKNDRHQTASLMDQQLRTVPVDPGSELFFLLTRMQDEVHRFAISYHRKLRQKAQTRSILDEVEGVGEVRKKKLMNTFKSFKRMKEASVEELAQVVPREVAQRIYLTLHSEISDDEVSSSSADF